MRGDGATTSRGQTPALIALNAALLGALALVTLAPGAGAQDTRRDRAKGDYTIVGGRVQGGGTGNVAYILDGVNEEMVVVRWDASRRRLGGIGFRDLRADAVNPRAPR